MAKKIRKCINAMLQRAKAGKTNGTFAVHADEVKVLEAAGFTVTLPKRRHEDEGKMANKNPFEVTISWETPKNEGGLATKLCNVVKAYRNRCNSTNQNREVRGRKQYVEKVVKWIPEVKHTAEESDTTCDFNDEEYWNSVTAVYGDTCDGFDGWNW